MARCIDRVAAATAALSVLAACGGHAAAPAPTPTAGQFSVAAADLGEAELGQLRTDQPHTTVLISPLSFEAALAMLSQGAQGDTAANLRTGLRDLDRLRGSAQLQGAADGFTNLRQSCPRRLG